MDIKERLDNEDWVDNNKKSKLKKDYKKHRNDVIRIVLILTEDDKIQLKNPIKKDMHKFMEAVQADPPDYKQLAINFKVNTINSDELFEQLISNFNLNRSE